jgi:BRCT domain type II-containing protein
MTVTVDDTNLQAIADAIRVKKGTSATYKPSEMAAAIKTISSGEEKDTVTVTVMGKYNGNYCYCNRGDTDRIDTTLYNVPMELEKTENLYIRAASQITTVAPHSNIVVNGTVVHTGSAVYTLSLTDYSKVTIVFTKQQDGDYDRYTCVIVAE